MPAAYRRKEVAHAERRVGSLASDSSHKMLTRYIECKPLLMLFGILIQPGGNSIILFDCRFSGTEPKQLGVCNFFFHLLWALSDNKDA